MVDNSLAVDSLPQVLPTQIYALKPRQFFDTIAMLKGRIMMSHGADYLVLLEDQLSDLNNMSA